MQLKQNKTELAPAWLLDKAVSDEIDNICVNAYKEKSGAVVLICASVVGS